MPSKKYFVSFVHYGKRGTPPSAPPQFGNAIMLTHQPICTSEQIEELTDQIREEKKFRSVTILNFVDLF